MRRRRTRLELNRRRKRKKVKRISLFAIIIGLLITGGILIKVNPFRGSIVEANISNITLGMIGEKNPVNMIIEEKIKEVEDTQMEIALQEKREEVKGERLNQKRQKQEELETRTMKLDPNSEDKVAYLTFDDGPSTKVTPMILDILDEYNAKATFFVVGDMVEENPQILKETFERGHAIGNHSYSHDYKYIYSNTENFIKDFNKAQELLKEVLGNDFNSRLIRFPGGSFGREAMKDAAINAGYQYIDWNALNGDAEGLNTTKQELINRAKETIENKNNVVILMHDTNAKENTALTLRELLDYLVSENYRFDTLD